MQPVQAQGAIPKAPQDPKKQEKQELAAIKKHLVKPLIPYKQKNLDIQHLLLTNFGQVPNEPDNALKTTNVNLYIQQAAARKQFFLDHQGAATEQAANCAIHRHVLANSLRSLKKVNKNDRCIPHVNVGCTLHQKVADYLVAVTLKVNELSQKTANLTSQNILQIHQECHNGYDLSLNQRTLRGLWAMAKFGTPAIQELSLLLLKADIGSGICFMDFLCLTPEAFKARCQVLPQVALNDLCKNISRATMSCHWLVFQGLGEATDGNPLGQATSWQLEALELVKIYKTSILLLPQKTGDRLNTAKQQAAAQLATQQAAQQVPGGAGAPVPGAPQQPLQPAPVQQVPAPVPGAPQQPLQPGAPAPIPGAPQQPLQPAPGTPAPIPGAPLQPLQPAPVQQVPAPGAPTLALQKPITISVPINTPTEKSSSGIRKRNDPRYQPRETRGDLHKIIDFDVPGQVKTKVQYRRDVEWNSKTSAGHGDLVKLALALNPNTRSTQPVHPAAKALLESKLVLQKTDPLTKQIVNLRTFTVQQILTGDYNVRNMAYLSKSDYIMSAIYLALRQKSDLFLATLIDMKLVEVDPMDPTKYITTKKVELPPA